MKSYKEFCKLAERYYEPHEPLPSGKTPKGKATSSYYRQSGEYFRNPRRGTPDGERTYKRMVNQRNRTWNQVSMGGDNPDLDFGPDRSGKYDVSGDTKNITISNRDGVRLNVRQKPTVHYDSSKYFTEQAEYQDQFMILTGIMIKIRVEMIRTTRTTLKNDADLDGKFRLKMLPRKIL